jgi:tetratricopeptide (TPR) repeat protein
MVPASTRPGGRWIVLIVLLTAATACDLRRQDTPWVGKRVVTKYKTPLRDGGRVIDEDSEFRVYTVGRVEGPWLLLEAGGVQGWVRSESVVSFAQAVEFYTQQVRAHPDDADAYAMRGLIRREEGRLDMAIADFTEAIQLDPQNAVTIANRGNAWMARGDHERAIADFTEAIRLDPTDARMYSKRASAWHNGQDYDKAIADYTQAVRLNPRDAVAFTNRGHAWSAKREFSKALADYDEAVRLDPEDATVFSNRGVARHNRGEYDEALADFDEAVRLDPMDAMALNNRAWLWATCPDQKHRDGERAVESAAKACELTDWKDANLVGTLAAAYAEAGDFEKAAEHQERAIRLADDPDMRMQLEEHLALFRDRRPYREQPRR